MGLNGIVSSALTALQTNSSALRVVSSNVANINTDGYARRVANEQALVVGGQLAGVDLADIQRMVDKYLEQESLSATSGTSRFDAQTKVYSQLNAILGAPGDSGALTARLNSVYSALGQAALAPSSSAARQGVLTSFQNLANSISSMSGSIADLQSSVDQQIASSTQDANTLIKQIFDYNQQLASLQISGNQDSGLLDNRDMAIQKLSQLMDVRTVEQPNGQLAVMTNDGISLVGDTYAKLSYTSDGVNGAFGSITVQSVYPADGKPFGTAQPLDAHLAGGSLRGLIDMRDGALSDLAQELGTFAQQTATAFNTIHNASAAFPPPATMTGRETGLLATDGLGFTGKSTIAIADANGSLVHRIDVDFDAGTLSVDGGATSAIGTSIGSFVTALNGAMGASGTADFTDGVLTLSASGGNGVVIQDDATTPSNRGGFGFSQFFGLNDVFRAAAPSILSTGLSSVDASGFAAGGQMDFVLKGPNGEIGKQASVTITAGMTIGDIVTALNTAFGSAGSFALASDGSLSFSPTASLSKYQLNVTGDTTQRGTTGVSFTSLFGLGVQQKAAQALSFSVNPEIASAPDRIAAGQPSITSTSVPGDTIVTHGDARAFAALQALGTTQVSFSTTGGIGAMKGTLADYAANFYQDVATRSQTATDSHTAQNDRLTEATTRKGQVSGVNLDEELSKMMMYQQAYSAGARMLQVVQQLYDTLLQVA